MHTNDFASLVPHMKRAGFIATITAAVITAKFGYAQGEDMVAGACLAILLALATFTVGYALVAARQAVIARKWDVAGLAVFLFAIAAGVELMSHFGFTAANKMATINAASMQTISFEDSRGSVKDLQAELDVLKKDRLNMQPVRMPAQATAVIGNAKAHKWWATTAECTTTLGPKTRRFCDDFRAAEADLALWEQIKTQDTLIAAKRGDLEAAKATAGTKVVGHSAAESQGAVLASVLAGSETPDRTIQYWSALGVTGIISLFAAAASCLLNYIAYAFDAARETGRRISDRISEALESGGESRDHLHIGRMHLAPEPAPSTTNIVNRIDGFITTLCPATLRAIRQQVQLA